MQDECVLPVNMQRVTRADTKLNRLAADMNTVAVWRHLVKSNQIKASETEPDVVMKACTWAMQAPLVQTTAMVLALVWSIGDVRHLKQ